VTWHVAFDGVAEAELEEALRWYRDRDPTLPGRMLAATQAAVAAIARRPP